MTRCMGMAIAFFLMCVVGCRGLITIEKIQVGPDKWPGETTTTQPSSTDADEALDAIWRAYK